MKPLILAVALALVAGQALAQEPTLKTVETRRLDAPEANQGVAADKTHLYAIDNGRIARYDKATGVKQAEWTGDPVRFKHLNACLIVGNELVCAGSNYPSVPQNSAVEVFDPVKMTHTRTIPLGPGIGSLTWVDRHDGFWWAMFANYDAKGGEPGRDHRWTTWSSSTTSGGASGPGPCRRRCWSAWRPSAARAAASATTACSMSPATTGRRCTPWRSPPRAGRRWTWWRRWRSRSRARRLRGTLPEAHAVGRQPRHPAGGGVHGSAGSGRFEPPKISGPKQGEEHCGAASRSVEGGGLRERGLALRSAQELTGFEVTGTCLAW
jgi:hypothetical protein